MKKILSVLLIICTIFTMAGCQSNLTDISSVLVEGLAEELKDVDITEIIEDLDEDLKDIDPTEITEDNQPTVTNEPVDEENTVEEIFKNEALSVHFIDVGQADAILIDFGSNGVLIDAGNNADADLVVNYLKAQGIEKLDVVIGTHPHEDHIGGLDVVIDTFPVDRVIIPEKMHTTKTFESLLDSILNKGLIVSSSVQDETFVVNGVSFHILAPNDELLADSELNNSSVVVKMSYGEADFLFTGDAENEVAEFIDSFYSREFLDVDVLKVPHHGSSSSMEFIEISNPEYAVIMIGTGNKYGHPNSETIDLLNSNNVTYYETSKEGDIIFLVDENGLIRKGE